MLLLKRKTYLILITQKWVFSSCDNSVFFFPFLIIMKGVLFFPCKDRWYVSHTCTDTHSQYQSTIPAYQTAPGQIAGSGRHTHSQWSLTTRLHKDKSPVRETRTCTDTHSQRSLPTRLHKGISPVRETCTCTDTHSQRSLPTRLHEGKSPVRETHTVNDPCLPDCTRANRRSGRHTHAQTHIVNNPCLPDCTRAMYIISKRQQRGIWKNIIWA